MQKQANKTAVDEELDKEYQSLSKNLLALNNAVNAGNVQLLSQEGNSD